MRTDTARGPFLTPRLAELLVDFDDDAVDGLLLTKSLPVHAEDARSDYPFWGYWPLFGHLGGERGGLLRRDLRQWRDGLGRRSPTLPLGPEGCHLARGFRWRDAFDRSGLGLRLSSGCLLPSHHLCRCNRNRELHAHLQRLSEGQRLAIPGRLLTERR